METETERNKEGKVERKQDKRKEGKEAKWGKTKCTYVYTHNEILLTHAKEGTNAFCSNVDETRIIILSRVSQRKTNVTWCHLCVQFKIWYKGTYLQDRNRLSNIKNEFITKGERWGVGIN